jgi:uncharacterized protein YggE
VAPARILLALLACLALPAASASAQDGDRPPHIDVVGEASLTAANDAARVTFAVEVRRRSSGEALRVASRRMRRVLARVRAAGIPDRDIRTESVSVRRERRRGRPPSSVARNAVRVVVREIGRVGSLIDAAVGAGATGVGGPSFFVSDTRALYRQALLLAFDNARAKAEELAARAGVRLGRPMSIREGGRAETDVAPPAARQEGSVGAPIRPGRTRVTATVGAVFAIE